MRRKAIFAECQTPLWLDVADTLVRELDCEPCYWVARQSFEPLVKARFPNVVFHARTAAIRGVPAAALANLKLRPLDEPFLQRFSSQQLTAGRMMDRFDTGDAFEYEEKVALFHRHLRYWRGVIEHLRPDFAIFPVQPHMLYDYLLYELSQHYGIRVSMFQWTLFHDTLYPIDHIDRGYREIAAAYQAKLHAGEVACVLSARWETYLQRAAGSYRDAAPRFLLKKMPEELRRGMFRQRRIHQTVHGEPRDAGVLEVGAATPESARRGPTAGQPRKSVPLGKRIKAARREVKILRKGFLRWRREHLDPDRFRPGRLLRAGREARRSLRSAYRFWIQPVLWALRRGDLDRPLKERHRPMETSFSDRLGGLRLQICRYRGLRRKRTLLDLYRRLSQPVRLNVPYIFVALHYQPEQTTCPTGGVFVDQWLMVDLLSKSVPDGWLVYVKEHPYQFFPRGIGERGRTLEFYQDLVALPNVRLVPWATSPFELIDQAKAVATVTGTTGTEALLRGKPVLIFGYAWYRDCEGVFYTPTTAACREALGSIAAGYRPNPEKVRLYFHVIEQLSVEADIGIGDRANPLPHDENVRRVASAIIGRLTSQAGADRHGGSAEDGARLLVG